MLDPIGAEHLGIHGGAVPLPGRVEVRDRGDAAHVAGAVGVGAADAVPVELPVQLFIVGIVDCVVAAGREALGEPSGLPEGVLAEELQLVSKPQADGHLQPATKPCHSN